MPAYARNNRGMRIATWNVNSIRTRVDRVVDWLDRADIDVLAMQEIKCKPEQFPTEPFQKYGYQLAVHGLNQWNGVAFASRLPIEDVVTAFPNMPGFLKGHEGPDQPHEARALGVTVDGMRLWSLYVPNGRSLDDPHYRYKLDWLAALADHTRAELAAQPDLPLALMGDFNIAPTGADMGDPSFVPGVSTHISEAERAAFRAIEAAGVADLVRPHVPEGFTFWDYQQLRFPRNEGMRIDFVLGSPTLQHATENAFIDREERKGDAPSDHVPVGVELQWGDEDDTPMIFG